MTQELEVYLCREYAGCLMRNAYGTLSFTYAPAYVKQSLPALSLSLPLRETPYRGRVVHAFFFGSLPGFLSVRRTFRRLMRRWFWNCLPRQAAYHKRKYAGLSDDRRWAWLIENGIETGAISLYPVPETSPPIPDDDTEIILDSEVLTQISNFPELYASLHGMHCMVPVRVDGSGRTILVKDRGPTLSTHFIKYVGERDLALNELFCMRLARSVGLVVPDVVIRDIEGYCCYMIERYDRVCCGHRPQSIDLLHQESLCQALSIPVGIWLERHGGPGVKRILALLHKHSSEPERDKAEFLARLVFGYLIGSLDINGWNTSLLYRNGRPELAPAYDFSASMSNTKMSISIGGECIPEKVQIQHWHDAVAEPERGILYAQLSRLSTECEEKAYELADRMEREGLQSDVHRTICMGIVRRAGLIKQQLRKWPGEMG